jgi:UDP-N-acetylmuramate--alanine ligase
VLKAAREATKGRVIAIAQPHRYHAPASLFDDFAACFNDADTVMSPGLCGRRGRSTASDSETLCSRVSAPAAIATRAISRDRRRSRRWCANLQSRAIFVVYLGAGNITQWAYALPKGELAGGGS